MFQRSSSTVLLAVSFATIAACGGSKGGNFQPVDSATAQAAGNSLGDSAEQSAGGLGGPSGPSMASVCQSGTETVTPAQPIDTDADNTPDTATVTFANCMVSGSNGNETINGTISIVDGTPATADYDFTATHALTLDENVTAGPDAGLTAHVALTGTRSASGAASGSTFNVTDATAVDATYTKSGTSHHITDAKTWDVTYTPSTAWTPGTIPVAGGLSITGSWAVHVDDKAADATLTSSGLQIHPACPTKITAGSETATFAGSGGQSATVTVTWTGCGSRTVVYAGP